MIGRALIATREGENALRLKLVQALSCPQQQDWLILEDKLQLRSKSINIFLHATQAHIELPALFRQQPSGLLEAVKKRLVVVVWRADKRVQEEPRIAPLFWPGAITRNLLQAYP